MVSAIFFSRTASGAASSDRPNILYIMSDDHAATAIGAYGSRLAKLDPTPTIDRLAREGVLFHNCFATNALCTPSRASIISGQYSHRNGVRIIDDAPNKEGIYKLQQPILPEKQLLPQAMQQAGYETAIVGKWHLAAEPVGFSYFLVLPGQGRYFDPIMKEKGQPWVNGIAGGQLHKGHVDDVIADNCLKWLAERPDRRTKPFFLMMHFKSPHDMFENAHRYDKLYEDVEIPEPESLWTRGNHGPIGRPEGGASIGRRSARKMGDALGLDKHDPPLSDDEFKHLAYQLYLKRYLRCVRGVDDNVARLLKWLEDNGQLDSTVIVYTADQGMLLGEHDYMDKRWIYEESARMPLIIRYPKRVKAGSTSDAIVTNVDYAPTLLDLAGIPAPPEMQGRSFAPILEGNPPPDWPKEMYYRYWMHMAHDLEVPGHFGIRTDRYKLAFFYGLPLGCSAYVKPTEPYWEMYDLQRDPHEMNNCYADPAYAETVKDLKTRLIDLRKKVGDSDEAYPELQDVIRKHWDDVR